MNLCVFQGTFNPIHYAHIKVAEFALKNYCFDKILFIPAYIPPHKNINKELAYHRLNMVKIATKKNPNFEVSDIEYKREKNSYTYETILELKKIYNLEKINFLIGTDAFEKIDTWYKTEELKKIVHFIVFPRCNNFNKKDFDKFKELGYDFDFAPMNYIEISSTDIRNNFEESTKIPEVMEYIKEHELYRMAEK